MPDVSYNNAKRNTKIPVPFAKSVFILSDTDLVDKKRNSRKTKYVVEKKTVLIRGKKGVNTATMSL
jgi:hypothetical protein